MTSRTMAKSLNIDYVKRITVKNKQPNKQRYCNLVPPAFKTPYFDQVHNIFKITEEVTEIISFLSFTLEIYDSTVTWIKTSIHTCYKHYLYLHVRLIYFKEIKALQNY